MSKPITIGITIGDINGVGPEVTLKAVYESRWPRDVRFVLVGSQKHLATQGTFLGHPGLSNWSPGAPWPGGQVAIWDPHPQAKLKYRAGKISIPASRAAHHWIVNATQACMDRAFDGMVTAPICKEGFDRAGLDVPGHTELIASLTKTKSFAMMLLGGPLRVVTLTRHIPLRAVPQAITAPRIEEAVRLTAEALGLLGSRRKAIAVCGLNPHAGDGGAIGTEEQDIIEPALKKIRKRYKTLYGPLAGDTVFHDAIRGKYDAVISMYHDQGLAPLKTVAFEEGVNFTLGLPIVRTSPDHGTAFNIAGRGSANPSSMVEAIRLAVRLAAKRNPWRA